MAETIIITLLKFLTAMKMFQAIESTVKFRTAQRPLTLLQLQKFGVANTRHRIHSYATRLRSSWTGIPSSSLPRTSQTSTLVPTAISRTRLTSPHPARTHRPGTRHLAADTSFPVLKPPSASKIITILRPVARKITKTWIRPTAD